MTCAQLMKALVDLKLLKRAVTEIEIGAVPGEGVLRAMARRGLLDEGASIRALAAHTKTPLADLRPETGLECDRFKSHVTPALLWQYRAVPLRLRNGTVIVAVSDPFDVEARRNLQFALQHPIEIQLAPESAILTVLAKYFPNPDAAFGRAEDIESISPVAATNIQREEMHLDANGPDTPPIIRLCNKIISDAVRANASDIHLDPNQDGLSVRLRVDGTMQSAFEIPKRMQAYVVARFKILGGMDIAEKRRPQDGRVRVRLGERPIDMRASTVPTPFGEKLVLRVLHDDMSQLTFERLGADPELEGRLTAALDKRGKMLLVTGPTGSGKTTTLYTCLNYLRDGSINIVTVEDPIEYRIPGINQIQVDETLGVSFAGALRSVLRQDPDVILIGEIRDAETAKIAMQAAQTGHLVLSTLHANDAPAAVTRLTGLGVDPHVIASSVEGVLAQRLVRRLCGSCGASAAPEELDRCASLIRTYDIPPAALKFARGCDVCRFTGYRGMIGLCSYLPFVPAVIDLVAQGGAGSALAGIAAESGFVTLERAAARLLRCGLTTFDEVKPYLELSDSAEPDPDVSTFAFQQGAASEFPGAGLQPAVVSKPTILLIEDDTDMRDIMRMVLQREMYDVVEAGNGEEGLRLFYEKHPQLVICDLMMPVMDGKEFLSRIRSNTSAKHVPVIMLTAVDSEDNEVNLLDLGAYDFVSKAASTNVMLSRVRHALKSNR